MTHSILIGVPLTFGLSCGELHRLLCPVYGLERVMSLMADLLAVAEEDYASIDQTLNSIERRITDAGASVDDWTIDQATVLREAANGLRVRLDCFQSVAPDSKIEVEVGKIRAEMLNIDDLRRAVATFGKFVSKWVDAE